MQCLQYLQCLQRDFRTSVVKHSSNTFFPSSLNLLSGHKVANMTTLSLWPMWNDGGAVIVRSINHCHYQKILSSLFRHFLILLELKLSLFLLLAYQLKSILCRMHAIRYFTMPTNLCVSIELFQGFIRDIFRQNVHVLFLPLITPAGRGLAGGSYCLYVWYCMSPSAFMNYVLPSPLALLQCLNPTISKWFLLEGRVCWPAHLSIGFFHGGGGGT